MMKKTFAICSIFLNIFVLGCASNQTLDIAGIKPLSLPKDIIENPLGTTSIKIGMSKDKVKSLWGNPDAINTLKSGDNASGSIKEEWVYKARQYSPIAVDVDYLSKTKHLIFDGKNLIKIEEEK